MTDSIYSRFENTKLILRDELAIDRTLLANERTLLAYLRSGLSLMIAGATIIHFSQSGWFWVIGIACLPMGLVTIVVGVARYRQMNSGISLVRKLSDNRPPDNTGAEPTGAGGEP